MADTVTIPRAEYERLVALAEDAADIAAVDAHAAALARGEIAYLPDAAVARLLAGEHPLKVVREHRGLTQQVLARAAAVDRSYLAEIETGRKPGSAAALGRLARALGVTIEDLLPAEDQSA